MNVLLTASGDFLSTYGGGQIYVQRLVDALRRREGFCLTVLSFPAHLGSNEVEKSYADSVPVYCVSPSCGNNVLKSVLEEVHPDIVHANGQKARMALLCQATGIPCIVTAHHGGILCPEGALLNDRDEICSCPVSHRNCLPCCLRNIKTGSFWSPFMRLLPAALYQEAGRALRRLPFIPFITPIGGAALNILGKQKEWATICAHASAIVAPSHAMAKAMERNGMPMERIRVIPHGVPEAPTIRKTSPARISQFFYVGRISRIKGLHLLLSAFHQLEGDGIRLHLVGGAGNKTEKRYMKALQKAYGADTRIIWHGKIEQQKLPALIRDWHVMVMPSICLEVYGLTISEALILGKPVLSTRCGGAEMQIAEGRNGWLVPPNSTAALYEKMKWLLREQPTLPMDIPVNLLNTHVQQIIGLYEEIAH